MYLFSAFFGRRLTTLVRCISRPTFPKYRSDWIKIAKFSKTSVCFIVSAYLTSKLQASLDLTQFPRPPTYVATSLSRTGSPKDGSSFRADRNLSANSSCKLDIHFIASVKPHLCSCITIVTRLWRSSPRACLFVCPCKISKCKEKA